MNASSGIAAAFTAGLVTSLHCAGMCGPLSCAIFSRCKQILAPSATYHLARIVSYTLLGGTLAWFGQPVAALFERSTLLSWAFAVLFLLFGFGLDKRIKLPAIALGWFNQLDLSRRMHPVAALFGFATPLIPCGPLYMMLGVALMSGSATTGATLMFSFAAGTLPVYWVAQSQFLRVQSRISPSTLQWIRQGLALASAVLIVWRTSLGSGLGVDHPSCCH